MGTLAYSNRSKNIFLDLFSSMEESKFEDFNENN